MNPPMNPTPPRRDAFTLVEVLLVTVVIGIVSGLGVVAVTGVREQAREARLQNDVTVLNNGIDAYRAAGGVIPAGLSAEQVIAKLKTVADPASSTAFGPSGPFIDPRLQLLPQSAEEGARPEARADYPNAAGYFYVRQGGAPGIKDFVRGEASAIVTEARQGPMGYTPGGEFLTAYTDQTAPAPAAAAAPEAVAGEDEEALTGKDLVKFPRPLLEVRYHNASEFVPYNGESLELLSYPLAVRISSPLTSAAAQLYVGWDGAPLLAASNPSVRADLDVLDYPAEKPFVVAQIFSSDPARFANSDPIRVTFRNVPEQVQPVFPVSDDVPATLTYLQAGGPMLVGGVVVSNERPPITVVLSNIEKVPSRYFTLLSGGLTNTYTARYNGATNVVIDTNFSQAGGFQPGIVPINIAGFGTNTSIAISASVQSANSNILVSGQALSVSTAIEPTPLTVDILPLKPIGLPPAVTIPHSGDVPVGMRKVYTLTVGEGGVLPLDPRNGGVPIPSSVLYSAPITNYPIATYTVVAQATGPAGAEHWFTCAPVNRTYIAITQVPLSYIGLNMFRANINGYVKGSIYMQAGDFAILNAGATIEGNVYVPGLPAVNLPGGVTSGNNTVVANQQAYVQTTDARIQTNRITGREYTTEGFLADPQQDLRKIVDLYGSTTSTPATYEVKINPSARIDGKLYRRADPPPITSQKPGLPSDIVLSNAPVAVSGSQTLAGGSYAVTLNATNSVLRLGSPGNLTQYVFGPGSTWTAGRVEILGPVQIYLNANTTFSGVTFGSSNTITQAGFVVMSNFSVTINNSGAVYGQFDARDSIITVGSGGGSTISGSLFGSALAREVSVAGSGYVDVSGGSDTNTVVPGPSPTPTPRSTPSPTPTT